MRCAAGLTLLYGLLTPLALGAQSGLPDLTERLARSWSADLSAWRDRMSGEVTVFVHGESHQGLTARQAVATLRSVQAQHRAGDVRIARVTDAGGDPRRGFAELEWETVARGTSEAARYTVFIGLTWTGGAWRIQEVRVIPD
jgi:hypothetical protein